MNKLVSFVAVAATAFSLSAVAESDDAEKAADMGAQKRIARGKELFHRPASCGLCHGADALGGTIGPSLIGAPTPFEIGYQFKTNPEMGPIAEMLDASNDDLIDLSFYITDLVGKDVRQLNPLGMYSSLARLDSPDPVVEYEASARDKLIEQIAPWESVVADWKPHAKPGPLKRVIEFDVIKTYEPSEPVFTPEPGKVYFYENLDSPNTYSAMAGHSSKAESTAIKKHTYNSVVVGDAATMEIIASNEMTEETKGQVHTTVLSPDGKYIYMTGPAARGAGPGVTEIFSTASLMKLDALTLKPIKMLASKARLHHGQIFRDKYVQLDTFVREPDGLDIFHLDPETDKVVGGIRCEDLGGSCYTSFTDDEFIYVLMQPHGYGPIAYSGFMGAGKFARGALTVLKPFWVAKLDPETWEVLEEWPYPGYRGDWITIDSKSEFIYIPSAGSGNASKINMKTGQVAWTAAVGSGPYGSSLTADETELWVANKGEATMSLGRTITILDAATGHAKETLFAGYMIDHVLLSPNGEEMWATSNIEGKVWVFDAITHEKIKVIDMPGAGNPHGTVWVHYDEKGVGRVVADQGGFHHGIHPAKGVTVDY